MSKVIAITGHRPDDFLKSHYTLESAKTNIEDIIVALKRQYGEVSFNVGGALGVDQWAADACIKHGIPYHLYLPFMPKIQTKYWKKEDKDCLNEQIKNAKSLTICDPSGITYDEKYKFAEKYQDRNEAMVDNCNIVVAFWLGKRRGGTYNCIKYALKQSKQAFNGLDGLNIICEQNLKEGWTPQKGE